MDSLLLLTARIQSYPKISLILILTSSLNTRPKSESMAADGDMRRWKCVSSHPVRRCGITVLLLHLDIPIYHQPSASSSKCCDLLCVSRLCPLGSWSSVLVMPVFLTLSALFLLGFSAHLVTRACHFPQPVPFALVVEDQGSCRDILDNQVT